MKIKVILPSLLNFSSQKERGRYSNQYLHYLLPINEIQLTQGKTLLSIFGEYFCQVWLFLTHSQRQELLCLLLPFHNIYWNIIRENDHTLISLLLSSCL